MGFSGDVPQEGRFQLRQIRCECQMDDEGFIWDILLYVYIYKKEES